LPAAMALAHSLTISAWLPAQIGFLSKLFPPLAQV
jgi:hypothetical protein